MAAAAVDLVAAQLNRNERGLPKSERTTLIQAEWRDGTTIRPAPEGKGTKTPLQVWSR